MKYTPLVKLVVLLALQIVFMSNVHAATIMYGEEEDIHDIKKLEGTKYYLCYKTTTHFFIAGLYVEDDGYVLRKENNYNRYIPLDNEKIKKFQSIGMLPDPLPEYSLGIDQYLFGYSLWLIILALIAITIISSSIKRASEGNRIRKLMDNPHYTEAMKIALNSDDNGFNKAVDYLCSKGISLEKAQADMQLLLSKGDTISV
jgi:hypothetical protein